MKMENPSHRSDQELGMSRDIPRRDFLNGAAMAIGSALLPAALQSNETKNDELQNQAGYNPPVLAGLRGSHPGSFEIAHSLRDGTFWKDAAAPEQLAEKYDLIIVGAGISGLAAAHFYRERAGAGTKILILENHDDFGGHAKRNEFHLGGKLQLLNGGTMLIDNPTPHSLVAAGLLKQLGIDPVALDKKCTDRGLYRSLGMSSQSFSTKKPSVKTAWLPAYHPRKKIQATRLELPVGNSFCRNRRSRKQFDAIFTASKPPRRIISPA